MGLPCKPTSSAREQQGQGRHGDKAGRYKNPYQQGCSPATPGQCKLRGPVMAAEVRQDPSLVDEYSDEAGLWVKLSSQPVSQGQDQVRTVTGVRHSAVIAGQAYSGKACPRSTWEIRSAG